LGISLYLKLWVERDEERMSRKQRHVFKKRALLKPYSDLPPYPDEAGAGSGLSPGRPFFLGYLLMLWTVVAIVMGVGLTGRGLPLPCLA